MKNQWDKNEWQGRSEQQVMYSIKIIALVIIAAAVLAGIASIYYVVKI